MSAEFPLTPAAQSAAREIWFQSAFYAIRQAKLLNELEVHKEHVNRILEPYLMVRELVTATSWQNFLELRTNKEKATPAIVDLANQIEEAIAGSKYTVLKEGDWHLPYINNNYRDISNPKDWKNISVALCARLSYSTYSHEERMANSIHTLGKDAWIKKQIEFSNQLLMDKHLTPFEHVARPMPRVNGELLWVDQYCGWQSLRNYLRGFNERC
jgi:hypothetical protein